MCVTLVYTDCLPLALLFQFLAGQVDYSLTLMEDLYYPSHKSPDVIILSFIFLLLQTRYYMKLYCHQ